jgi:hypothetical protein
MLGDVKVRVHTFRFIAPADRRASQDARSVHDVPPGQNAPAWATDGPATLADVSPWRVQ